VRKRGARRTAVSKNSVLEDKLDDIVSLLRNRNPSSQHRQSVETIPTPGSSEFSPDNAFFEGIEDLDLTDRELLDFRERRLPYFPLMHLSSDVMAAELQREKPTLCLAIRGLTTKAASKQAVLSKKLREVLTRKILVDGVRSVDLLLSLLACIAW
jgi:hypothetical protein